MTVFYPCEDLYSITKKQAAGRSFPQTWQEFYEEQKDIARGDYRFEPNRDNKDFPDPLEKRAVGKEADELHAKLEEIRTVQEKCEKEINDIVSQPRARVDAGHEFLIGEIWWRNRRPFYRVYPKVVEMLKRTSLDMLCSQVPSVCNSVCLQMPVGIVKYNGYTLRSIFMSKIDSDELEPAWISKFVMEYPKGTVFEDRSVVWHHNKITQYHESLLKFDRPRNGDPLVDGWCEMIRAGAKIGFGAMILASQPEMVSRVYLSRDNARGKNDEAALNRAINRGVNGWDLGKKLERESHETSGHVRRPYFGLRWTGKGREKPKLVPVKGCLVNRHKLTKIPEGYLDQPEPVSP